MRAPASRARSSAVRRSDANAGRPGSYGSETVTSAAARERFEQRPLRAGEIFEAVREHRLAVPGIELRLEALRGAAAQKVPIPAAEPVELGAVRGVERREIAVQLLGVEQPGLELAQRLLQRIGEPAEPRGRSEAVELRRGQHAAHEQRALRLRHERPRIVAGVRDALEDIVERSDRAREQRGPAREQFALNALDIRSVRHDEHGLPLESGEITVEQRLDLARVRRPSDQAERHRPIVEAVSDSLDSTLCGGGLRLAAATRDGAAGHRAGAVVAEVGLLRAAARVRERHAEHRAFPLLDFLAAVVANENGFPCHGRNSSRNAGAG